MCLSPRLARERNKSINWLKEKGEKDVSHVTEPKKPIRKSQHRLNSQENGAAKAEGKPSKSQIKEVSKEEKQSLKACTGDQSGDLSECKDKIEAEVSVDQTKEPVLSAAPAPEIMPQEVTIAAPAPDIMPQEVTIGV